MATTTVLTNVGRGRICSGLVSGITAPFFGYMSFGKNSGHTAVVADTALATELTTADVPAYARVALTNSLQTTSVTHDTFQQSGTLAANGSTGVTLYETGTQDLLTAGDLLLYCTSGPNYIAGTDTFTMTLQLQIQ